MGHCSALPSPSPAKACSAPVDEHRGLPCDTRVATGTPGSHLHHAHGPLGLSMLLEQTSLRRCDASPPVSFATASGKGPLPQLQPHRSLGHRETENTSCLYGQKRTLTILSPHYPFRLPALIIFSPRSLLIFLDGLLLLIRVNFVPKLPEETQDRSRIPAKRVHEILQNAANQRDAQNRF